jgi:hypothetical protein
MFEMYRSRSYDTRPRYSSPLARYVKLASDPPSPSPPSSPVTSPTKRKTLASPFKPERPKLRLIVPATRGYARERHGVTDDDEWAASGAETDDENGDGEGEGWGQEADEDWQWVPKGTSNGHPVEDGGSEEGEVVEVKAVEEGARRSSFLVSTLSESCPIPTSQLTESSSRLPDSEFENVCEALSKS